MQHVGQLVVGIDGASHLATAVMGENRVDDVVLEVVAEPADRCATHLFVVVGDGCNGVRENEN